MNQQPSSPSSSRPIVRTLLAGLIVLVAAYVLLKVIIGIALAIAGPVVLIAAVVALIWALRVLL
jgi:hypothetical protein